MKCAHSPKGIMMAGLILTLIGIGIVLIREFQVPGYWVPLALGVALLAVGAIRRGHAGGS
jgi:membrane-bound ClpP family serine protease